MGIEFYWFIFGAMAFLLGASFASFAGVIAFRTPRGLSVIKPDSYCPACQKPIRFYDNIPILSYIILRGKCRDCGAKIGIFGFLCEIFGAVGFLGAYLCYGRELSTLPYMFDLWALIILFIVISDIDMQSHEIYDATLVVFALISVGLAAFRIISDSATLPELIFGSVIGFAFFIAVKLIAKLVMKRDALGGGDIFLSGIAGAFLGVFAWLIGILIGTLVGSIVELIKIKVKKTEADAEIAFGPYLLLGFGIMAVFGELILKYYWSVML